MNGIILAAGAGRRLRPETNGLPKALLPVDGPTTILDIGLRNLALAGMRNAVVVVGYAADAIRRRKAELEQRHGVKIDLITNDRAEEWNNAYSLWLARDYFIAGALLLNGDTVHPPSVEQTLLTKRGSQILLAIDTEKPLADEEMKVVFDSSGKLSGISKSLDPASAHGEYIGVCLIEGSAAEGLANALAVTWRRDPHLYYEDGIAEFAARGGAVGGVPIGSVEWIEVDNQVDLSRAREIACRY